MNTSSNPLNTASSDTRHGSNNPLSAGSSDARHGSSNPLNPTSSDTRHGSSNPLSAGSSDTRHGSSNPLSAGTSDTRHGSSNPLNPTSTETRHGSSNPVSGAASEARQAVEGHMGKSGHHNTTVHESIAPGITHENVQRTQHENVTTAVDKEIHQHHYHTSVQPITDKQVLPEKHSHNLVPVEHREFEHGDPNDVKTRLAAEEAKFKDERVVGDVHHTHSVAPVMSGEHIHHHVHETIQPVVQKQTVQPAVVHTTVPIHETHHNAAQHHSTSALPAVSMDEFRKQGGSLTGRDERQDSFEGEPRSVGGALSGDGYTTKPRSSLGDKVDPRTDSNRDGKKGVMS